MKTSKHRGVGAVHTMQYHHLPASDGQVLPWQDDRDIFGPIDDEAGLAALTDSKRGACNRCLCRPLQHNFTPACFVLQNAQVGGSLSLLCGITWSRCDVENQSHCWVLWPSILPFVQHC